MEPEADHEVMHKALQSATALVVTVTSDEKVHVNRKHNSHITTQLQFMMHKISSHRS
jgi:hypothetical protein